MNHRTWIFQFIVYELISAQDDFEIQINWPIILTGGSLPGENATCFTSMLLVPLTKQVTPQYSVINSYKQV